MPVVRKRIQAHVDLVIILKVIRQAGKPDKHHALRADPGSIVAAQIADEESSLAKLDTGVVARNFLRIEHYHVVRPPPDGHLALERNLPRAPRQEHRQAGPFAVLQPHFQEGFP